MSIYIPNEPNQRGWFDPDRDVIARQLSDYCDGLDMGDSVELRKENEHTLADGDPVLSFVFSDGSGRCQICVSATYSGQQISYWDIKPPDGVNCLAAIAKIDAFLEWQQEHHWTPYSAELPSPKLQSTEMVDGGEEAKAFPTREQTRNFSLERKWQFDGFRWDWDDAIRKCLEELSITTDQIRTGPDRSISFLDQPRSPFLDGKPEPPGLPRKLSLTPRFFNGVGEITGVAVLQSDWELHDAKIKTLLSHLRNVRRLDVPEPASDAFAVPTVGDASPPQPSIKTKKANERKSTKPHNMGGGTTLHCNRWLVYQEDLGKSYLPGLESGYKKVRLQRDRKGAPGNLEQVMKKGRARARDWRQRNPEAYQEWLEAYLKSEGDAS